MKLLLASILAISALKAQTGITLSATLCKGGTPSSTMVLMPVATLSNSGTPIPIFGFVCAQIDPAAFIFDKTTSPPTLRLKASSSSLPVFARETPAGTLDGVNTSFTLAFAPSSQCSVDIYRNGLLLTAQQDYTINGQTITFLTVGPNNLSAVPQPGDILNGKYCH